MVLMRLLSSIWTAWILSVQFKRSLRLMKEGIGSDEKVRCEHVFNSLRAAGYLVSEYMQRIGRH